MMRQGNSSLTKPDDAHDFLDTCFPSVYLTRINDETVVGVLNMKCRLFGIMLHK